MSKSKELLYGAVLAGGQSSRMGKDKRFLKLDGEFLVDRSLKIVAQALGDHPERVYLCGDVGGRNCMVDLVPGLGPLGGVWSALKLTREQNCGQTSFLLVVPVDMPLLTPEALGDLISAISSIKNSHLRAITFEDFEMPFVIHCDLFSEHILKTLCDSKWLSPRSIRSLQNVVGVYRLPLKKEFSHLLFNANSPSDWAKVNQGTPL